MTDTEAIDNIRALHCGDYNCQLPGHELEDPDFWCKSKNCEGCFHYLCYTALQERIAGQHPDHFVDTNKMVCENQPLTLEELRKMDGEPVWIEDWWQDFHGWKLSADAEDYCAERDTQQYGTLWLAYRRKPEEEKNEKTH